jgi:hypothetical protein
MWRLYERAYAKWASNVFRIGTEVTGGATARQVVLESKGDGKADTLSAAVVARRNIRSSAGD